MIYKIKSMMTMVKLKMKIKIIMIKKKTEKDNIQGKN